MNEGKSLYNVKIYGMGGGRGEGAGAVRYTLPHEWWLKPGKKLGENEYHDNRENDTRVKTHQGQKVISTPQKV